MANRVTGTFTRFDVETEVESGIDIGVLEIAIEINNQTKALLRPDTGRLRNGYMAKGKLGESGFNNSGGVKATSDEKLLGSAQKGEAFVGTNVEYAPYEEFGTRNRGAKPALRPAYGIVVRGGKADTEMKKALNNSVNKAKIKSRRTV